ncbi:MAG TPA: DUF4139 domain-containing protein [Burkholderiaceae bacterium]|jgi:hypothetical protein|nr:DUF4139 domain-containing protein [Burkholderiaceae bacterium]
MASPRIGPFGLALAVTLAWGAAAAQSAADSPEVPLPTSSRTSLGITVYNDGEALVRDVRRVSLSKGTQRIAFREVAATIRPETASLKSVSGAGFDLLEQNFDFDLLTPTALLRKYVGRSVTVIRTNPGTGAETSEQATVLATNDGVVLRYPDRIETGVAGRLAFSDVPPNLRDRPTLSVLMDVAHGGDQQVELTYLANQVGWKADYIANLNPDGTRMTLNGWVTLTNQSGTAYQNARLQLVAGTLNRVRPENKPMAVARVEAKAARAAEMIEEKLGDYHLYTLPRATTIENNQTKQVALLSASGVPVQREYVLQNNAIDWWYQERRPDVQKGLKAAVYLRFENKGGELGIPLPAGVVRAYLPDSGGGTQLIGEDAIAHTARGEQVSLRLGEAFDLTVDRVQTDFQVISKRSSQSSYRIELRNADSKPATVTVREPLHGDWKITSETQEHVKESAGSAVWKVVVPAEGKAVLEYTAVVSW